MLNKSHAIELHCHSTASDGTLTPEQLLREAEEAGITHLALTDHDTLAGSTSLRAQMNSAVKLIAGVEFSCRWNRNNLHVLAYDFEWDDDAIQRLLKAQYERRFTRSLKIAERLQKRLNLHDVHARVMEKVGEGVPGRPHFAEILIEDGAVGSAVEAFDRYLGAGKVGDVSICWPDLEELMASLAEARARTSVAHPAHYGFTATKLNEMFDEFVSLGGDAIEISVPGIDSGHYGWLAEAARRRKMAQSFGSDYHGSRSPWRRLGAYPEPVPDLPRLSDYFVGSA